MGSKKKEQDISSGAEAPLVTEVRMSELKLRPPEDAALDLDAGWVCEVRKG
jgi:hypothetical protein